MNRLDAVSSNAAMCSALKAAFPGARIFVRMSLGTDYGNASVSWTDGPSVDEVKAVTDRFEGRGFDGMTGRVIEVGGQKWISGVGLVLISRRNSPEKVAEVVEQLREAGYSERFEGCFAPAAGAVLRGCSMAVAADHHHLILR